MKVPRWMERGDLMSGGYQGLLTAAKKYRAGRGTKFQTFAVYHIRWGIQEEIRRCAHVSRYSDPPSFASLEAVAQMNDERVVDPVAALDNERIVNVATHVLNDIGGKERKCLALRYFFDKTLKEIGEELGMTESGAHRLHERAIAQCRFLAGHYAWVLK